MVTVLDYGGENQSIVKFEMHLLTMAKWLWHPTPTTDALFQIAGEAKFIVFLQWN